MDITSVCTMCGHDRYEVVYSTENKSSLAAYTITSHVPSMPQRIVRCLRCGLICANPQPSRDELSEIYRHMVDDDYLTEEIGRRRAARKTLTALRKVLPRRGRLLEIGCATGYLLDEARCDRWDVSGIEPSQWACTYARETFGLNVREGTVDEQLHEDASYDVVLMRDVIEHLPDPKQVLTRIRRLLRPKGIICVSTPNINSWISQLLGARWWGLKQLHLYYFSLQTLKHMLQSTGFTVLKSYSCGRFFSFEYLLSRLKTYDPFLFKLMKPFSLIPGLRTCLIPVNFGDQVELIARKSRQLKYFIDTPKKQIMARQDMKAIAVLPAYNAEKTLAQTVRDIPRDIISDIVLVDDASTDTTARVARDLGLTTVCHEQNKGYGANQKTCYRTALNMGADIIIMVHPDYQYDPRAIPELIAPIQQGRADAVFGSRMMKGGALDGGMPLWKHNANILLTAFENVCLGTYLTEYHSGFRAYSADLLRAIRFEDNADGFVFDTEIIVQIILHRFRIEEIPIRTRYFDEASSIALWPSIVYGLGIMRTMALYLMHTRDIIKHKKFL